MPARYSVTASIRERHEEALADEPNKSEVVQEALDQYYGLDPEEDD